ncbi:isopentenyl-diphosphate Delta-isomerase [Dactylosporangium siamense]|uniref:Isopentenyl-diphosphate Delta-isomerase n=1 Tax=Dactylosporangium siamense TaxID=685454 RepID=A0A919PKW6_9ACTN|nr:isopentenyl-diphosphate Delta-isomerase [Dactylosporangium siamense]GIG46576.1 isopentenyl-diphosphate Delta-isomerase [Dactylosporangium siamense]
MSRESHLVELVDSGGGAVGSATVDAAHRAPGLLHRAFSVVLVDKDGRFLLQQRAAVKTRFALRWANACCGHPTPGEKVTDAAQRRLAEELGVRTVPLHEVGVYVYQAADPSSGRVEFEYDHVLVGSASDISDFSVDPDEVAALEWIAGDELASRLSQSPDLYAPWLAGVVSAWRGSTA